MLKLHRNRVPSTRQCGFSKGPQLPERYLTNEHVVIDTVFDEDHLHAYEWVGEAEQQLGELLRLLQHARWAVIRRI